MASAKRVRFLVKSTEDPLAGDGANVVSNLLRSPKSISGAYVFDARGMAFYEHQCETPEYYLRRVEAALLRQHAAGIVEQCGFPSLVELGAGTARKTRMLLSHYDRYGVRCDYVSIDIDVDTLAATAHDLVSEYSQLFVHCVGATYDEALQVIPDFGTRRLFLFLGSSLGNLQRHDIDALLLQLYDHMKPGDFLLLGVDLHKDAEIINQAYNDAAGFGSRSSLNVLPHLNRRYGGNFLEQNFLYRSTYDSMARRNDVRLESLLDQRVELALLNFTVQLRRSELIDVEVMWKFDPRELGLRLSGAGFMPTQEWIDPVYRYGLFLVQRR